MCKVSEKSENLFFSVGREVGREGGRELMINPANVYVT